MVSFGGLKARVQLAVTILVLFQGLCNRKVAKVHRYASEQNFMQGANGELISGEKVRSLFRLLRSGESSRRRELVVGDILIRVVAKRSMPLPRIVLDVEFGNQLNPLYYNSVSSSDRCLLLLGRHFQNHLRRVFEDYLSRASFLSTESHIYFGGSRYYLESGASGIRGVELSLEYIAAFFRRNPISSSRFLSNYLLDLQVNGNRHFMPDNFLRNVFLTVLNDKFRGDNREVEGLRDIYGDLKRCADVKDVRGFSRRYGHYFRRRLKRVELYFNKEGVSLSALERVIRNSFRKIPTSGVGFDHLRSLTRVNPFSELAGGVLQINSNRVANKVTLMFPMPDQLKKRIPEVSGVVDAVLTNNELISGFLSKQTWVSSFCHEFEHNDENGYVNLLLNFFSKRALNSKEELPDFNLTNLVEVWLRALNTSSLSPARQGGRGGGNGVLDPVESDSELANMLQKHLGIANMVIVIYSNRPITIKGTDILQLNAKINEDAYWYLVRRMHSFSYLIRRNLLPKLGIKYLVRKQDYYFSTKYVYNNLPSSLISYLQNIYSKSDRLTLPD